MFLHVSMTLFTGEVSASVLLGYTPPPRADPPGSRPPRSRHPPEQTPLHPADPSLVAVHAGRYGQQTGGTHPTGMHTCSNLNFSWKQKQTE